jgi:hypothetical protein
MRHVAQEGNMAGVFTIPSWTEVIAHWLRARLGCIDRVF